MLATRLSLFSYLILAATQAACSKGEAPALMTQADRALLEKVKAQDAERASLTSNPSEYISGGQWKNFDKGIINTYTRATSIAFSSTSQFDIADPEGKITYLGDDGTELATVPFKATGEVRAGATVELEVDAGEISGSAKTAKVVVERVHVR